MPLGMHVLVNPISRRRMLQATAVAGLSAGGVPAAFAGGAMRPAAGDRTFGRAKSVILLWLAGGPP